MKHTAALRFTTSLVILVFVALITVSQYAAADIVFHDDFEAPSAQSPPAGWTMWGAQEFKVPAHYTLDSDASHGGQACFRIYHPARTGGYVVSSPTRAIRPRSGKKYTARFWARSNKPGKARFQWTAYKSMKPFIDSPSPGSLTLQVDSQWRQFSYTIREGLDFFSDQSRFLLLTFFATVAPDEEQTLWVDDVQVSEETDPHPPELLNPDTIAHDKLEHRLSPGERLEFTVHATDRLRRTKLEVGGVSFHRVCGWTGQPYDRQGEYTLCPELESAIRDLQLPMTRFYGVGDEPFSVESAIDKVAEVCRRVKAPQEACVLEFEEQGASRMLPPETWARGIQHSLTRGYAFHHWEIANEPYSSLWGDGGAFPTPDAFVNHFVAVSKAIRNVDNQARIGVDIHSRQTRWGNYLLKQLAGHYDFVAPHYYCGADVHRLAFEDIVLTENYRMLDRALRIKALLKAYNGTRPVYQYDTEWGMICSTPDGKAADYEDRNANIIGTVHRAVRLIYYVRENIVRGASGWQMLSRLKGQGFGILSQEAPQQRFMLYWLYYYFNRHVGPWALQTTGTAPYHTPPEQSEALAGPLTPVLATRSEDGQQIYLVIANGSWTREVPCYMHFPDFPIRHTSAVVLTSDNLDGKPLLDSKKEAVAEFQVSTTRSSANCMIPPHAVVFITLTKQ